MYEKNMKNVQILNALRGLLELCELLPLLAIDKAHQRIAYLKFKKYQQKARNFKYRSSQQ